MTTEQLKKVVTARPFRPFTLRMADGNSVTVQHPETIAYAGGRTAIVVNPDETFEVIDLLLVPSIEVSAPTSVPPAGPEGRN